MSVSLFYVPKKKKRKPKKTKKTKQNPSLN